MGGTHSPTWCQQGQSPGLAIYWCPIHLKTSEGPKSPGQGRGRCLSYSWEPPLLLPSELGAPLWSPEPQYFPFRFSPHTAGVPLLQSFA